MQSSTGCETSPPIAIFVFAASSAYQKGISSGCRTPTTRWRQSDALAISSPPSSLTSRRRQLDASLVGWLRDAKPIAGPLRRWVSPGFRRGQPILRSGERRLDALRQREEAAVCAVLADHHQPDGRRARRLDRDRDGAAVEEVDDRGVAQD